MTDENRDNLENGSLLGHYRVLKKIGAGGMGEVYLAEDSRLRRKIALKVLPRDFARDDDRLRRFEQEAFAASGLNHPNILTIYEFGEESGTHFLASEFVEGETLRERTERKHLTIEETLQIAIQTAEALSAAHDANIVHRDIKPENIMIRPDHLVKILDFGLAKLTEKRIETPDDKAETIVRWATEPGMIMGTFAYMSPEQARATGADARADIWSLGCVLYEIIAGTVPFPGETPADCIVAIIKKNHVPLTLLNEDVPPHLDDIIGKCLEKDREERYQSAKDLLIDLRRLKRKLEFETEKERSSPDYAEDLIKSRSGFKTRVLDARTGRLQRETVSSAEYLVEEIKRNKFFAIGAVAILALIATGFVLYKYGLFPFSRSKANIFASPQKLKIKPLAVSGKVIETAISPDGKYAAYVVMAADKYSIRLRQNAANSDVEIVAPTEKENYGDLIFTADGDHIYYTGFGVGGGTIYKVPILGGAAAKIAENTLSGAGVSPDGKSIAFFGIDKNEAISRLMLADADGSNERPLPGTAAGADPLQEITPAWSPDGKAVAGVLNSGAPNEPLSKILAVNVADGSRRVLNEGYLREITSIKWFPEGDDLIVCGKERSAEQNAPAQLWLIAPNSEPRRIMNDLNSYFGVSITATGESLMTTQHKKVLNLWVSPAGDPARSIQVPSYSGTDDWISWTPEGKLLYCSAAGRYLDIWMMNADGADPRALTANQYNNCYPSMTKDGRYIVFLSNRADSRDQHVFRMDADRRNLMQLTKGEREGQARLSPDGKWVYYGSRNLPDDGAMTIYKTAIEGGGDPIVIRKCEFGAFYFDVSPRDGAIAYGFSGEGDEGLRKITVISPEGVPVKTFMVPSTFKFGPLSWTQDGRAIAFLDTRDEANIWAIALDGNGDAKPITDFRGEPITGFAWSQDGKQMAVIRGTLVSEAILIIEAK